MDIFPQVNKLISLKWQIDSNPSRLSFTKRPSFSPRIHPYRNLRDLNEAKRGKIDVAQQLNVDHLHLKKSNIEAIKTEIVLLKNGGHGAKDPQPRHNR